MPNTIEETLLQSQFIVFHQNRALQVNVKTARNVSVSSTDMFLQWWSSVCLGYFAFKRNYVYKEGDLEWPQGCLFS